MSDDLVRVHASLCSVVGANHLRTVGGTAMNWAGIAITYLFTAGMGFLCGALCCQMNGWLQDD